MLEEEREGEKFVNKIVWETYSTGEPGRGVKKRDLINSTAVGEIASRR